MIKGIMYTAIMITHHFYAGDLKEIAAIEFGIPLSEVDFERWPHECANHNPVDTTVLNSLHLPQHNQLRIKMIKLDSLSSNVTTGTSSSMR